MKTKPISIRFEEEHLSLAQQKSGIQKVQKLVDFLLSEYVRDVNPLIQSVPADFKKVNLAVENKEVEESIIRGAINRRSDLKAKAQAVSNHEPNLSEESEEAILAQIKAIEAEKIPKERDTPIGRKTWQIEQTKRIEEKKKRYEELKNKNK